MRGKENKTSSSHTNSVSGSVKKKSNKMEGEMQERGKARSRSLKNFFLLEFSERAHQWVVLGENYLRRFFRSLIMLHYEIFISFC
jgi:hypothetical protein